MMMMMMMMMMIIIIIIIFDIQLFSVYGMVTGTLI